MKILILGSDGYIGYPLTLHLLKKGHEVFGVDSNIRRERVNSIGGGSLTPITSPFERKIYLKSNYPNFIDQTCVNLGWDTGYSHIKSVLSAFTPDCIVHLAEQPSAPFSMMNATKSYKTQQENVLGTLQLLWAMREVCPDAHLVKIGTMGEYGTPDCDIPEGIIPKDCLSEYALCEYQYGEYDVPSGGGSCPMSGLLFPRQPGSFYHLSKVHDTYNIKFACDTWGLRSTDIMQGVVFGVKVTGDETEDELTRFDYDEYFGTAINRFCVQALIRHPLTIYGKGNQTRGYLSLKDSIQCLTIAIENAPASGEYRTWNQFESMHSINDLADMVITAANLCGFNIEANSIPNPRKESEDHYYNPTCQTLFDLGYQPTIDISGEIRRLIANLEPYKNRIIPSVILPKTTWR